jgi:hypothetical protein
MIRQLIDVDHRSINGFINQPPTDPRHWRWPPLLDSVPLACLHPRPYLPAERVLQRVEIEEERGEALEPPGPSSPLHEDIYASGLLAQLTDLKSPTIKPILVVRAFS